MFQFSKEKLVDLVRLAQKEVDIAVGRGDGPFAALLIDENGNIIETASNTSLTSSNAAAHAEINLLVKVGKLLKKRNLSPYAVVTNAAPCSMCMSALIKAKIGYYFFGAPNEPDNDPALTPEQVAAHSKLHVKIVSGILKDDCIRQIRNARAQLGYQNKRRRLGT